jgi:putative membrane protein
MVVPGIAVAAIAAAYVWAATRASARAAWPRWRAVVFMLGAALLELGLHPGWLPYPEGDFRKHMLQHLVLAMIAPIAIVMGAPVTLFLRTAPRTCRRLVICVLRGPVVRIAAHPVVALVLDLGGMAALYFTPLYHQMMMHPALHQAVHLHFVAAGCLYAWAIAGPDPAPARPSVPARLAVLGLAVVIHSVLSQLLYAGWFVVVPATPAQLQAGAALMYYGGDIAEMLLAVALVTTWRPQRAAGAACRRWKPAV